MVSNRAVARELGIDEKTVRKGVASGVFRESVAQTADGKTVVVDLEIAKREWIARGRPMARTADTVRTVESAPESAVSAPDVALPRGRVIEAATLVEAQRLATLQRERKLRLESDVMEGRLVEAIEVQKEAFEAERLIRENILNLPARIAGDLAAETDPAKVGILLDRLLREALNVAADALLVSVHA